MTTKHEHDEYAPTNHNHEEYTSKTLFKSYTLITLGALGTICTLMIFTFSKTDAAVKKSFETEIKIEKHMSDYTYVKETLEAINAKIDKQQEAIHQQTQLLVRQDAKLNELDKKIDTHVVTDVNTNGLASSNN